MKRSSQLKRKTPMRRSCRPLPTFSRRRKAQRPERDAVREAVFSRDGYRCTAAVLVPAVACGGPLDCHEVIPRSAWSGGYLEQTNARTVCRRHHDWIGAHPTKAYALGLHGYSWERPA